MARLQSAHVETPLGTLHLAVHDGLLVALSFPEQADGLRRDLARRFREVALEEGADSGPAPDRVRAYFRGDLRALEDVPVDPSGTVFQRRVWSALRGIAPGSTVSYSELARRIGSPTAVRAVAAANARNPVAIVIPCHRVIGADGSLIGYGGGLDRKRWLLAHERALPEGERQAGLPLAPA